MKKYCFDIEFYSDHDAGLRGFTDKVIVSVESGDPGGDPGEFEVYMEKALSTWFDGAFVILNTELKD